MASKRLVLSVTTVLLWSYAVLGDKNITSALPTSTTTRHGLHTESFTTIVPGQGSTSYYITENSPSVHMHTPFPTTSTLQPNQKQAGCKIRVPRPNEMASLPCPSPITVDHAVKITHIVLSAVIFLLGLTGNALVIRIVATKPDMRNAPNVLLAGLACGDLLFVLLCVPITAYNLYTVPTTWIFGPAVCKLLPFLQQTSLGVTVLSLMALSADRYTAVVSSTMSRLSQSWRGLGVRLALIWSLAVLAAVPAAVTHTTRRVRWHHGDITVCGMDQESPFARTYQRTRVWLRFALYFCLPLAVTAVHYSLMAKHMMRVDRLHRNTRGMDDRMSKRRRAARVVLCIVALFALCWLPYHLTNILRITLPCSVLQNICTFSALQGAIHFGLALGSFNSCVNPIALYILSRKYKIYMDALLFCCCSQGGDELLDPRRGSIWTSRHRPSCDVTSMSVAARLLRRQEAFANESTRSSGLEMGSQAGDSSERNSSVVAD
ncbi:endothelin receptor type B-like [Branchiostoma floridae x Branchiostoma belcheri]